MLHKVLARLLFALLWCSAVELAVGHAISQSRRSLLQRNFRVGTSTLVAAPFRNSFNDAEAQSLVCIPRSGRVVTFTPVAFARRQTQEVGTSDDANCTLGVGKCSARYTYNYTYLDEDEEDIISLWQPDTCSTAMSALFFFFYQTGGITCDFTFSISFPPEQPGGPLRTFNYSLAQFTDSNSQFLQSLARRFNETRCGPTPLQPPSPAPPPMPPPPPPPAPPCTYDIITLVSETGLARCLEHATVAQQLFGAGINFSRNFQCASDADGLLDAAATFSSAFNNTFFSNFQNTNDTILSQALSPFVPLGGCQNVTVYAATRAPCPSFTVSRSLSFNCSQVANPTNPSGSYLW